MPTSSRAVKLSLADPYLKTTRAHVHLETLKTELQAFIDTHPCSIRGEDDIENGTYNLRIHMDEVPDLIPLIAGDFLYCLRSALDQTAWCLAKITTAIPEHTQFPIFDVDNADSRRKLADYTKGIPTAALVLPMKGDAQ